MPSMTIGHQAVTVSLLSALLFGSGHAISNLDRERPVPISAAERRDGQRDFDFEFGTSRLLHATRSCRRRISFGSSRRSSA